MASIDLPAVRARDLGKRFRNKWALANCSIAVPQGAVVQFLRPHYLAAATYTGSLTSQQIPISPRAWLITKHVTNAAGHVVDNKGGITGPGSWVPKACQGFGSSAEDRLTRCLTALAYHQVLRRDA